MKRQALNQVTQGLECQIKSFYLVGSDVAYLKVLRKLKQENFY